MQITKIDFLRDYLKQHPNEAAKDASEMLDELWGSLPKSAKTMDRASLVEAIDGAMECAVSEAILTIADCPYVRIEIVDRDRIEKLERDLVFCKNRVNSLDGYVDGLNTRIRTCESNYKAQRGSAYERS